MSFVFIVFLMTTKRMCKRPSSPALVKCFCFFHKPTDVICQVASHTIGFDVQTKPATGVPGRLVYQLRGGLHSFDPLLLTQCCLPRSQFFIARGLCFLPRLHCRYRGRPRSCCCCRGRFRRGRRPRAIRRHDAAVLAVRVGAFPNPNTLFTAPL